MIECTLDRVDTDIANGNLGRARDRMHGLIAEYPTDLSLRPRLAEIYHRLQHPGMAGRYWYLHDDQSERITAAISEFERSTGQDAYEMLCNLNIRWDPGTMEDGYALDRLQALMDRCLKSHKTLPVFRLPGGERVHVATRRESILAPLGCVAVFLLILCLIVLGVIQLISWL